MNKIYDIVVIGGGHAGIEAAAISTSFGHQVLLLSLDGVPLASTPCNPSIGGVGKGQVVREIDALGGVMGLVADRCAIQCRRLNESKGPAVMSTRFQVDKDQYSKVATSYLLSLQDLDISYDQIIKITFESEENVFNIEGKKRYLGRKVIVTAGTFLDGITHIGEIKRQGGRIDTLPAPSLENLIDLKINKIRFKTGTPARLDKTSVDYSKFAVQGSDPQTKTFHFNHSVDARFLPQVECYIAHTNEKTLSIIRAAKERSPLFNGQICGVGPRYCPSIEDKAFRYPDRNVHHVFIEPEGLELPTLYPNGLSTSLPLDVQESFLRSIEGLENVKISVPGYAVEYDAIDTTQLSIDLSLEKLPGLYFAGQINGTSGYEEAAAQGLIAGINASRALLDKEPLVLSRLDSYIGVMIEDLVTNKRDEPYRLFTARSENRLYIREDNTVERMFNYRSSLGLNQEIDKWQMFYMEQLEILEELSCKSSDKSSRTIAEELKNPKIDPVELLENLIQKSGLKFIDRVISNCAINIKYAGYVDRAKRQNVQQKKLLSKEIDWNSLSVDGNISFECRQRIKEFRPTTFSQLKNILGIRPATLAYVAGRLK